MSYSKIQHRELSILVGILVGVLLDVFATSNSITNFSLIDLIIFLAIPAMTGALAGFADPDHAIGNGILVGIIAGLVYVVIDAIRLPANVETNTVLFLGLVVPIWGFIGGTGSTFAHRTLTSTELRSPEPAVKICVNCKASNPPDALFCKNCGTKLAQELNGRVFAR